MTTPENETLTTIIDRVDAHIDPAFTFCTAHGFPLGAALIAHRWREGSAEAVLTALVPYQNEDGGFGNGLEVDIAAPQSNPFATRLAMQALLALNERPGSANTILGGIDRYLATAQDERGDFRLTPDVLADQIAPWFAGWTYPNLNPSACLAGLAYRLGIGTPSLFARVEAMIATLGDPVVVRSGGFYEILPYAEYAPLLAKNGHTALLDATVDGIVAGLESGTYDDASHALDHALGGGEELAERIPRDLLAREASRLLAEQQDDGGWPTPYDPAWRPWATASACLQFATLKDMSR